MAGAQVDLPVFMHRRFQSDDAASMTPVSAELSPLSADETEDALRTSREALRRSEAALREAQRLARIGSWSWNAQTDVTTGSEELFLIYGLDPASEKFPDFKDQNGTLYPRHSWTRLNEAVRETLASGRGYALDLIALRRGVPIWVTTRGEAVRNADGRVGGVRGTVQDIDERKKTEEQLRLTHATFFNLIEAAPFGVYVIDAQFRLAQVSAGSQKVFSGVRPLLGRDFAEVLRIVWPEPFASEAIGRFRHTLATGEPYAAPDTTEQRHDIAAVESYDWKIQRIALPDGSQGVVCYFFDITARQEHQQVLARAAALNQFRVRLTDAVRPLSDPAEVQVQAARVLGEHLGANRVNYFEIVGTDYLVERGFTRGVSPLSGRFPTASFSPQLFAAYVAGRTVVNEDVAADAGLTAGERAAYAGVQIGAYVGVPLVKDGRFVGGMAAHQATPRRWTPEEVALVEEVAERTWAAVERTRAEASLRESQEQLALVSNTLPALVSYVDRDGRYRMCNRAYTEWFGFGPEQILGRSMCEVLGEKAWQAIEPHIGAALAGQAADFEAEVPYARGGTRWIHAVYTPHRDDGGNILGLVIMVSDITARKRTEEALHRRTAQFETLLNQAPLGVYLVNADFRICDVNPTARLIFANVPDVVGRDFGEVMRILWPQEQADDLVRIFRHTLETGEPYETPERSEHRLDIGITEYYEWRADRITLPDGRHGVVCYFRDITRQVFARAAIAESEARFRTLAENIAQLAWTADRLGCATWYNRRWYGYTGTTFETMRDRGWERVHHPDHLERVRQTVSAAFEHGTTWEDTFPLLGKHGEYRWFLSRAVPIRNEAGEIVQWLGTNTDITERRETEEALRQAKEEAEAAGRAKDDFLAALSHELRTPLAPVLLTASELEASERLDGETREQMGMIRRNIELEARLIDDLLDLTKVAHGKFHLNTVVADLHELLEHTRAIVEHDAIEKELSIQFALHATAHHVTADPARLQQMFWNLLKNAVKFSAAGGRIAVSTQNPAPGRVRVTVTDEGIGMTAEALGNIFRPFDQGDLRGRHRFGGLGLGLAISKAIADLHQGELRASSPGPDRGATFTFELDVAASGVRMEAPAVSPAAARTALQLLLVEDHLPSLNAMVRLLERDGHRVRTAGTLLEALRAAENHPCDAVISDLGLPDGTGYELMNEIKARKGWPGIALSGFGMDDDVKRSREAGFIAHLTKPVSLARLRAEIEKLPLPK